MLHRKVPIARPVIWSTGAHRTDARPRRRSNQALRTFRFVAVAKPSEVSFADPQRLRRFRAAQSARTITLQPFNIPPHPYLGSHPDSQLESFQKPDRSSATKPGDIISYGSRFPVARAYQKLDAGPEIAGNLADVPREGAAHV
jgi:hypothetical protein